MNPLLSLFDDLTGVVFDYALSTPPSSQWLMCYGQALTPGMTAAAKLRQKLIDDGNPYGVSGSDPLLPDARGRVSAGKDNMGGSAASRLTTAVSGIDGATLGASGGSQSHTLTAAQMPTHAHGATGSNGLWVDAPGLYAVNAGGATLNMNKITNTDNAGSGNAHPNAQPTLIMNKIIRL